MEDWRKAWVDRNAVLKIIIFNLVVFAILFFWEIINGLPLTKNGFESELSDSAVFHPIRWLALDGAFSAFLKKPWTLLTYMFVHERLLIFLPVTIWLYCFGSLFQTLLSGKQLLPLYLYGGIIGGIIYILASTLMQANYYLATASVAVMTIAAAVTTLQPKLKVFASFNGGFPLWILSLIYALLTFITVGSLPNVLAHIGGIATGYFFAQQLQKGHDWTSWLIRAAGNINDRFQPATDAASADSHQSNEVRLNKILDKINSKGMRSLSHEDKIFLKNHSK